MIFAPVNKIYKQEIKRFLKDAQDFCDKEGIEFTMRNFLFYKKNAFCSPAYRFLFGTPKVFLISSRAFREYYYTLDFDFQRDILTMEQWKSLTEELQRNKKLQRFIKNILQEDFVDSK